MQMDTNSWEVLRGLLSECSKALLDELQVDRRVIDKDDDHPRSAERVAAFIGFTGSQMRGALTLDLPCAMLATTHPSAAAGRTISQELSCDWAGELANQLMGRFKNALARYDINLDMSTPSTVWGRMTPHVPGNGELALDLHFAVGRDRFIVYAEAVALKPIDLTSPREVDPATEPHAEGDMMLF